MSYQEWLKSEKSQSYLRQEELILAVTDTVLDALDRANMSKADLAAKLGVTRSHVSQLLSGSRNMTLRSLADIAHAVDHSVCFSLRPTHAVVFRMNWMQDKHSYRPVNVDPLASEGNRLYAAVQDDDFESSYSHLEAA